MLFGVQSMHAYVQFGWVPTIYRDAGLSASSAGALQGLLSGVGILGALAMPTVIARGRGLRPLMVSFGVPLALGYVGLLLAPATAPVAVGAVARASPASPSRPPSRSSPPAPGTRR